MALPPLGGEGGRDTPFGGIPKCNLPSGPCQDIFQKIFSKKILDFPLVKPQVHGVNKKWIPRSQRWTLAERQEKKLQVKNSRELRTMFWRESQAFRLQIEKEISEKVLAKRAALE